MEFDPQAYIEGVRESRKTDRERELERQLQEIAIKHREAMVAESAPLFEELTHIAALKRPLPVFIDGMLYEYAGRPADE